MTRTFRRTVGVSLHNTADRYRLYDVERRVWLRPNPRLEFNPDLPFSERWVECDPPEELSQFGEKPPDPERTIP